MSRANDRKGLSLLERLRAYGETDYYPFHMPGHKRNTGLGITSFPNPFSVDITEIDGFDNLHHPEGILKESMEKAALIYGADETYFLVNGSTCGILSAVCASVRNGQTFIMARNSHKSAYHAALVNRLEPVYAYPDYISSWGLQGGVDPWQIKNLLKEHPEVKAVFVTSPTYEGLVSDVETIAEIVHRAGAILIVDEAHGAHFAFGKGENKRHFPRSAVECGADLVIQSLHKTLPSLTQTALLHVKGPRVDRERLRQYLQIFQSSSPSYVFMAAIENCILYMEDEGSGALLRYGERMDEWMRRAGGLEKLRVLDDGICKSGHVKSRDKSKILVSTGETGKTGTWLAGRLRERYHLEPEMACANHALYMTSLMDGEDGLERLLDALLETDRELSAVQAGDDGREEYQFERQREVQLSIWANAPKRSMSIADAADALSEEVPAEEAPGRISAGFVTVYPPGVPSLTPGELISVQITEALTGCASLGLTVEGLSERRTVRVIRP